jgi:hypothetical protein
MTKFLTPGILTGILACAAALAGAFGRPALAAFLAEPQTAETLLGIVSGTLALAAGAMRGVAPPELR